MASPSPYLAAAYAEQYDDERFGGAFGRALREQETMAFRAMTDEDTGTVLDVGAGTGKLSLALAETCRLVAADASLAMLRIACGKARERRIPLTAIVCDARHLSFRDRSFDLVVSSRMLMHVPSWPTAVAELARVARRAVVVDYPPPASFAGVWSLGGRMTARCRVAGRAGRVLASRGIRRELERRGFEVTCVRRSYFLPVALHRWLDRPNLSNRIEAVCRRLRLTGLVGAPAVLKAVRRGPSTPPGEGS